MTPSLFRKLVLRVDEGSHRQATWLELFFDLAFVICVSSLTHFLIDHPSLDGIFTYAAMVIPIWWIWNQFTWYASHFDNDDLGFRAFILCGVFGTLFLSKGIHDWSHGSSMTLIGAYVFLHAVMGLAWIRAYKDVVEYRSYIRFKMAGVVLGILLWSISAFFEGNVQHTLWAVAVILQLLMPILAWVQVSKMISVHQHHLMERHGLFVMILLGECLLVVSNRFSSDHLSAFSLDAILPVLVLFGLWWTYFDWKYDPLNLKVTANAFAFNYGHFFLYSSIGVIAAGLGLGETGSAWVMGGVAVFLISLSMMNRLSQREKALKT